MFVLITYDVNTEDASGRKRLRQVAKNCEKYGKRVQCSVFECDLEPAQCKILQESLKEIIDAGKDSLRFYYLGNRYKTKIEHFGIKKGLEADEILIL
ncbi:MAG: CRISPR-associated endonuclease Cas2 [Lachnospiraceae bacterium]|nr:CRISPR-associated endonuclease Cas2 [Lachnospiraceae bacterium]